MTPSRTKSDLQLFIAGFALALVVLIANYSFVLNDVLTADDYSHVRKAINGDAGRIFDFWELEPNDVKGDWQIYGRLEKAFGHSVKKMRLYWRPWQNLLQRAEYLAFGRSYSMWKLTQFAIVALAAGFMAVSIRRLGARTSLALIFSLAYAAHPTRNLSVTWLSACADAIAALFVSAAFYFMLVSRDAEESAVVRKRAKAVSLFAFFLALGGKEIALTFAAVPFVYAALISKGDIKRRFADALKYGSPYFAVGAAYLAFRFLTPLEPGMITFDITHFPLLAHLMPEHVVMNMQYYLMSSFLLTPDVNVLLFPIPALNLAWAVTAIALLTFLFYIVYISNKKAFASLLFFYLSLFPVLFMGMRGYFATLPMIFLFCAVAVLAEDFIVRIKHWTAKLIVSFSLLCWLAGVVAVSHAGVTSSGLIPLAIDGMIKKFHAENSQFTNGDKIYLIHLWQSIDVTHGLAYPYLPEEPEFFVLTYNPEPIPMSLLKSYRKSVFAEDEPKLTTATIGVKKLDEFTIEARVNVGHFMDVPAAEMWLPAAARDPRFDSAWFGYSFNVEAIARDNSGYPNGLKFVFSHKLCAPRVHYFIEDGLEFKKIDFCEMNGKE